MVHFSERLISRFHFSIEISKVESILIKSGLTSKKEFIDVGIGSGLILFWFFFELEQAVMISIIKISLFNSKI